MTNPVLTGGEKYSDLISKRLGGSSNEPEMSFTSAQRSLIASVEKTKNAIKSLPQQLKMPSEFVVCVRMEPKYSAKSYYPKSIFKAASHNQLDAIGSRTWRKQNENVSSGKLIFARTTSAGLDALENTLRSSYKISDQFELDVRRIDEINLLTSDEKLMGFDEDWQEGYVEFIFHPFNIERDRVIETFRQIATFEDLEIREYESGIIFAAGIANRESIEKVKDFNPLRSIHPIDVNMGSPVRSFTSGSGPKPPNITDKNKITVGVIDGGIDPSHSYFKGVATNEDHTTANPTTKLLTHATWVTGMLLYGNLDKYGPEDVLPEPEFFVKSFRVLPQGDTGLSVRKTNELYDVIDEVEKIVPTNPDIKVYNLSMGPPLPVFDDYLTRFTYVVDQLSKKHDVQFCVAAGNEGAKPNPRIQSPADSVNAITVGAYSLDQNNKPVKADYSCIGPGREGNKLKPDLLALGGSIARPLQFVSMSQGSRDIDVGMTSLATPQVSAAIATLIGKYSLDPISSKSLLLNKVRNGDDFDIQKGHGVLPENIRDITTCEVGTYTLQYRGKLLPGKFAQLQIPWPEVKLKGKVEFTWTLSVLAGINELSTDEYTTESMEISFYPNDSKYVFTTPDGKHTKIVNIRENPDDAKRLLVANWKPGNYPKSECGPRPSLGEEGLRANMKWDTILQGFKGIRSADSISNPFFHLHCLARDDENVSSQTDYCLTLTVKLLKADQDIYSPIVARYSGLVPIAETLQQKVVVKSDLQQD